MLPDARNPFQPPLGALTDKERRTDAIVDIAIQSVPRRVEVAGPFAFHGKRTNHVLSDIFDSSHLFDAYLAALAAIDHILTL